METLSYVKLQQLSWFKSQNLSSWVWFFVSLVLVSSFSLILVLAFFFHKERSFLRLPKL